jgi:hypothetical protein
MTDATSGAGTAYPSRTPPVFSVTRSLALCVCFVVRCLYFCTFSFGHCVVCPSLIYGFWLLLLYLQTLLNPATYYWSVCAKPGKSAVMYLCVRVCDFASLYDFFIGVWNCSDIVVCSIIVLVTHTSGSTI